MAASAIGGRLIASSTAMAATKTQTSFPFLSSSHLKIKQSYFQTSLRLFLLPPILSLSSPLRRLSPSSSATTPFIESYREEEPQAAQKQELSPLLSSRDAGRLYVGNLPFTITSSELADIFSQAGTVDSVEIVYNRLTNRSRGFGLITMDSAEEAKEAIRMFDGALVGGRTVKVNFPAVARGGKHEVVGLRPRSPPLRNKDGHHGIYAGNLGWKVTSEMLRDAFSEFSGFVGAKVIYERDSGRSRGFGFINFASVEACQAALQAMDGKMVAGRPLRLNLSFERSSSVATSSVGATNVISDGD